MVPEHKENTVGPTKQRHIHNRTDRQAGKGAREQGSKGAREQERGAREP